MSNSILWNGYNTMQHCNVSPTKSETFFLSHTLGAPIRYEIRPKSTSDQQVCFQSLSSTIWTGTAQLEYDLDVAEGALTTIGVIKVPLS